MRYIFQSKLVGERITVAFNFLDVLVTPETLVGHAVEVAVDVGLDPEPELLLFGAGEHTATRGEVSQQIQLGVPGVIYWLICTVQTDLGNTYRMKSRLAILPSPMVVPDILSDIYTTELYPIEARDVYQHYFEFIQGRLNEQVFSQEYYQHSMSLGSGELYGGSKSYSHRDEYKHSLNLIDGIIDVVLITHELPPDEYQHAMDLLSGEIDTVVIEYTLIPDEYQHSMGFPSGNTLT